MRNSKAIQVRRWALAVILLLLGLVLSGTTAAKATADHWPARVQARAVSAQQALQRRTGATERKVVQAAPAPLLALLFLVLAYDKRRTQAVSSRAGATPRDASLWLVPYLFRPPPVLVVC
jgi:hypothetical protein